MPTVGLCACSTVGTSQQHTIKRETALVNIYVGNLAYQTTEEDLKTAFASFGEVSTVNLIKDRYTGQSKGFAFVEMASNSEADAAIKGLNQQPLDGRVVTVNQAKPRSDSRPSRSGGGGGGGGRY